MHTVVIIGGFSNFSLFILYSLNLFSSTSLFIRCTFYTSVIECVNNMCHCNKGNHRIICHVVVSELSWVCLSLITFLHGNNYK